MRRRGTLVAYRLGPGRYLAIDPSALPALNVMAEMLRAPLEARRAFLKNPRAAISGRVERRLRGKNALAGLSDEGSAEAIERAVHPLFVETRGCIERVLGVTPSVAPALPPGARPTTTWFPECLTGSPKRSVLGAWIPFVGQLLRCAKRTSAAIRVLPSRAWSCRLTRA